MKLPVHRGCQKGNAESEAGNFTVAVLEQNVAEHGAVLAADEGRLDVAGLHSWRLRRSGGEQECEVVGQDPEEIWHEGARYIRSDRHTTR